ncbi:hypothetical protein RI367_005998 [Sorochytrium milnesiophthora]
MSQSFTPALDQQHPPYHDQQQQLPDHAADLTHVVQFLQTAPVLMQSTGEQLLRHRLPTGEFIACIFAKSMYYVTGTDIVRTLTYFFVAINRPIVVPKKFEEGIFSDLRNLKHGTHAQLEEARSDFLEWLHKHNCVRTQKKQKVFYWFCVPWWDLFRDALERDLKREKLTVRPADTQKEFEMNPVTAWLHPGAAALWRTAALPLQQLRMQPPVTSAPAASGTLGVQKTSSSISKRKKGSTLLKTFSKKIHLTEEAISFFSELDNDPMGHTVPDFDLTHLTGVMGGSTGTPPIAPAARHYSDPLTDIHYQNAALALPDGQQTVISQGTVTPPSLPSSNHTPVLEQLTLVHNSPVMLPANSLAPYPHMNDAHLQHQHTMPDSMWTNMWANMPPELAPLPGSHLQY